MAFPKHAGHTRSEYSFSDPDHSKMTLYYTERDTIPEGLYRTDLDIAHGTITPPQSVLQYDGDTYIGQEMQWENNKSALIIATGSKPYYNKHRNAYPSLLRLKTP